MRSREELAAARSFARMALLLNVLAITVYLIYLVGEFEGLPKAAALEGLFELVAILALFADTLAIIVFALQSFNSRVALVALIIALAAVFLTNTSLLNNVMEFILHTPSLILTYLVWMSALLFAFDRHITSRLKAETQSNILMPPTPLRGL
jgi:hypothetical protein